MIAKTIVSTLMTWTTYRLLSALYLNYGRIFFSSISFLDNISDYAEHVDRFGGIWILTIYSVQVGAFISQKTSVFTFYVTMHTKYAMYAISSPETSLYQGETSLHILVTQ